MGDIRENLEGSVLQIASQGTILSFNLKETKLRRGLCHFGCGLCQRYVPQSTVPPIYSKIKC